MLSSGIFLLNIKMDKELTALIINRSHADGKIPTKRDFSKEKQHNISKSAGYVCKLPKKLQERRK